MKVVLSMVLIQEENSEKDISLKFKTYIKKTRFSIHVRNDF